MGLLDLTSLLAPGLPPPTTKWSGFAKYNFIGGHNDADQIPLEALIKAANDVLTREGRTLATYGLSSGPQGYRPLREFLARKLERTAGIRCDADEILITSGSLQALDLVNGILLTRGDSIIIEQATYQGALTRLQRLGVEAVGIPLDGEGMCIDALAAALDGLKRRGVRPKYIYTVPTVQNPTGTILSEARRHEMLRLAVQYGVPIFEDDCYSDLIWDGNALRNEPARRRHSRRLVFQISRPGIARRLHCRAVAAIGADARAQDRCRFRRAGADGAWRVLPSAFRRPCAGTDPGAARQARNADGCAQRAVRHRGRIRGPGFLPWFLSVDHSAPGLMATPAASAGAKSFCVST